MAQTKRNSADALSSLFAVVAIVTGLAPLRAWADPPGNGRFLDHPDVPAMKPELDPVFTPPDRSLPPGFRPYPLNQAIVSISPTVGSTDTGVVIRGRHRFQSPSAVHFGTLSAASFYQQGDGSILAYSPYTGVGGTSVAVSVTDRGGTFTSTQHYSYFIAEMDVTGPLPFSPSAMVDAGWDRGRGRLIRMLAPPTLTFVQPPDLHVSTSFFDDTMANPATYQGADWAVGTYATFRAILQMCDLNGTPPAGGGACANWDGNQGTWVNQIQVDGEVDSAGDDTTAFGDMVLPTAQFFNDQNLVRTFRLRLSLQQHDAVVHERAQRRDSKDTAPFNAVIVPAAFIQVRAIPYTIVYQPPGNLSTAQFQTSTTYSNTFKLGNSSEQSNSYDSGKSSQLKFGMTEGLNLGSGVGLAGTGDFGEKWDQKTTTVVTTAQGTNETIATTLGLSKAYTLPALQTTIPGNGDTCAGPFPPCPAPGAPPPSAVCTQLNHAPDPVAIQPFWNDRIVFMVHPQFAAWVLQSGKSRYTLMSAVPSTASASVAQLAACWYGSSWPGTNACELDYSYSYVTESNGYPVFRGETGSITLTSEEAGNFLRLDPFFDGQRADIPTNRGLPLGGTDYGARICQGPTTRQLTLTSQVAQTHEVTNNKINSVATTSVHTSDAALSFGLDAMKLFGLKVTQTDATQDTYTATLKTTYLDSTATVETDATAAQVTLNDVDKTTGINCGPQCHDPLPHQPSVNMYLDRLFGGFMFQDPGAARHLFFHGPAWMAGRLLSLYASEALNGRMFADVEPGSRDATAIGVLGRTRVLSGDASGRFHPEAALSRGDLSLALTSALRLNADKPAAERLRFADLREQPALMKAALATASKRMVSPRSASEFGPQDDVTRGELAIALTEAFRPPEKSAATMARGKGKEASGTQLSRAIENVVKAGYMRPRDKGEFAPEESVSRAEAAGALYAALSDEVRRREREDLNTASRDKDNRPRLPAEPPADPASKAR